MGFLDNLKSEIWELNEMTNADLKKKNGDKFEVINLLVPIEDMDPKEAKKYKTVTKTSTKGRNANIPKVFVRLPITPDQDFKKMDQLYVHCKKCNTLFIMRQDYLSSYPECPHCDKNKKSEIIIEPKADDKTANEKPKYKETLQDYHKRKQQEKREKAGLAPKEEKKREEYIRPIRKIADGAQAVFEFISKITNYNTEKLNNEDIIFLNKFLFNNGFEISGTETSYNIDALFVPIEEQAAELYQQEHGVAITINWNKDPLYINDIGIPKIRRQYKLGDDIGEFDTMIVNGKIRYEAALNDINDIY
jgi:DNA-directed RNA polymerase subunit M/transcription elongation factor TFIIS